MDHNTDFENSTDIVFSANVSTAIKNASHVAEPYQILLAYSRPSVIVLTLLSLLLNSLVIAILVHQRRTHHQSWGQLHLMYLAGSDLSLG